MEHDTETYREREDAWDQAWPDPESSAHGSDEPDNLDEEEPYPDVVGTSDSLVAVRDAEPYAPPTDPPVLPGGREGIDVATGFGFSADEESVREPAPRGDDDVLDQVLLVLRQDSVTSTYSLDVVVDNGVVTIRGPIGSIDEAEHAQAVVSELPGVVDVVDETTLTPA
jgi:hypothetical protein